MGCHAWLYKKAKNLTRDEKIRLVENLNKYGYRDFVQRISREDFIKEHVESNLKDLEVFEKYVAEGIMDKDDFQYEWAKEYSNPDKVAEWYDESVEMNRQRKEAYENFIKDPDSADIVEVYKVFDQADSADMQFYKGEWYIHLIFDTYFRCYEYGDKKIDNYEDMIKYLEPLPSTMIRQYGTFDENGNFSYYDPVDYTGKDGLTDELKDMLKYLYKDNDIFIEFT